MVQADLMAKSRRTFLSLSMRQSRRSSEVEVEEPYLNLKMPNLAVYFGRLNKADLFRIDP